MNIRVADRPVLVDAARVLFRQYADFVLVKVGPPHVDNQSFEREIAGLPAPYRLILLAEPQPSVFAGCIALRDSDHQSCELKRLYVAPAYRRLGIARRLMESATDQARALGYHAVCLNTEPNVMPGALTLYRELGFLPDPVRQTGNGLVYLQRVL